MADKKTNAAIYLILRQLDDITFKRSVQPSQVLQRFDTQSKGYLNYNEFQNMMKSMLESNQYSVIPKVWEFITNKYKTQNITGEMLNDLIYKVDSQENTWTSNKTTQNLQKNNPQQMNPNLYQQQPQQYGQWSNQQQLQQNQSNPAQQQPYQYPQYYPYYPQQPPQNFPNYPQYPPQNYPAYEQSNYNYPPSPSHQNFPQNQNWNNQIPQQNYPQAPIQQPQKQLIGQQQQISKPSPSDRPITPPKQQQPTRTVQQIFQKFTKNIEKAGTSLKDLFELFDQDYDKYLNYNELKALFFNVLQDLTEQEFDSVSKHIFSDNNSIKISQFHLMKRIQEVNASVNSIKMNQEQPKIEKNENKKNRQIFDQVPKGILESNIYENPMNRNILSSKIDFQEYITLDSSISGFQFFANEFQKLRMSGKQYLDNQFPPNEKSLGNKLRGKVDQWKRLHEIYKSCQIFVKDVTQVRVGLGKWISPSDIHQGELGDCYFLASVSSIACRRPDIILDLFVTRKVNPNGIYCIKINVDGEWRAITIDDYVPTRRGQTVFTKGNNQEVWALLLEKAWAKIFGGYDRIEAGTPREVLRALTGAPSKTLMTDDENFFQELKKCAQQKCIMVSGSYSLKEHKGHITDTVINNLGLVPGHAYSILKLREITHPKLGKVQLVKLRNPWANKEWRGDWSDNSPLWTPELKQQLKINQSNEGVFYMDISSLMMHFSDVQVCYLKENYKYQSISLVSDSRHSTYLSVTIKTAGEYYFSVCQKNTRFHDALDYSAVRIFIGEQIGKNNYRFVSSCNKLGDRELWCSAQMQKGNYVVQIKTYWPLQQMENLYHFSSYGPENIMVKQIQKVPELISSVYYNIAINAEKKTYEQLREPLIKKAYGFSIDQGYGYFYCENKTNKKYFESDVQFTNSEGIKLKKPFRGQKLKVKLEPQKHFLAIFSVSHKGYSYSMQEQLQVRSFNI